MSKENTMPLEKLFGSKTRAKLLALFFENPDKSYYVREINALGLVKIENYENKVYYSANMKHPFARPMTEIFSRKVIDTVDTAETVRRPTWADYVRPVENILNALVVTNRLPGQEGLDLLIIGDDRGRKLTRWAELVEKKQGKPLNYAIMSREDYLYRKSVRDRFLADVMTLRISEKYDPEKIL